MTSDLTNCFAENWQNWKIRKIRFLSVKCVFEFFEHIKALFIYNSGLSYKFVFIRRIAILTIKWLKRQKCLTKHTERHTGCLTLFPSLDRYLVKIVKHFYRFYDVN